MGFKINTVIVEKFGIKAIWKYKTISLKRKVGHIDTKRRYENYLNLIISFFVIIYNHIEMVSKNCVLLN